jgi:hypothetical protein
MSQKNFDVKDVTNLISDFAASLDEGAILVTAEEDINAGRAGVPVGEWSVALLAEVNDKDSDTKGFKWHGKKTTIPAVACLFTQNVDKALEDGYVVTCALGSVTRAVTNATSKKWLAQTYANAADGQLDFYKVLIKEEKQEDETIKKRWYKG